MLTDKKTGLSLRIASKTLSCAQITKILGLPPTEQLDKGTPYSKRYPKRVREEDFWIYGLDLDERLQFEEHLEKLVGILVEKRDSFKQLVDCEIDIFCYYSTHNGQGGPCVESRMMGVLADLGIDIIFDIYCTREDGESRAT